MNPWGTSAVLAAGVALGVAGCGSSSHTGSVANVTVQPTPAGHGTKRFAAPGMAVHFDYPQDFKPIALGPAHAVGSVEKSTHAAVGLGSLDFLRVTRFPRLRVPVDRANIASLKSTFDQLVSQAIGTKVTSRVGSAGGLPALFWAKVPAPELAPSATLQLTNVFVGADEYELTCEATSSGAARIAAACSEMTSTLTATP